MPSLGSAFPARGSASVSGSLGASAPQEKEELKGIVTCEELLP